MINASIMPFRYQSGLHISQLEGTQALQLRKEKVRVEYRLRVLQIQPKPMYQ